MNAYAMENPVSNATSISLAGVGLVVTLATATAQAAPFHPIPADQGQLLHLAQDIYIDGYHRHRHHHGYVYGDPRRPHLDCTWHGDHEHCQIYIPRRRYYHHRGHVRGNPYRTHLDCRWHGDHEHCRVHRPRRHRDYYRYYY